MGVLDQSNRNESKVVKKNGVYYKLVPPDGGWGYMVCLATVIVLSLVDGPTFGLALILSELLESVGIDPVYLSVINGLAMMVISLSGYLAPLALRRFSIRQVGLAGCLFYVGGTFGVAFMKTPIQLILFLSIFMSIGISTIMVMAFAAFNTYFDKKKKICNSIIQTIAGLSSIAGPHLVNYWRQCYGLRGCVLILSAITMHSILGFLIIQPIKKHHRLVKLSSEESNEHMETMFLKATTNNDDEATCRSPLRSFMYRMVDFLNLTLFKDVIFTNICIGNAMILFTDSLFTVLLPMYLFSSNWNSTEVATLLSLSNLGDLSSRICMIGISSYFSVKCRTVVYYGVWLDVIVRFIIPQIMNFTALAILACFWGFARGLLISVGPLMLAEHLPVEKYPVGQGLTTLAFGFIAVLATPFLGAARNLNVSQAIILHVLTSMSIIVCLIPWSLEIFILRFCKKPQ